MGHIISGVDNTYLEIDSSKAARATFYRTNGEKDKYVERFKGSASTFRTLGNATAAQNLLTLENNSINSPIDVYVKGILFVTDQAAITTVSCDVSVARTTAIPTGGSILVKNSFDTGLGSSLYVVLRGATASDGGAATAITATPGTYLFRSFSPRVHTQVGQVIQPPYYVIPMMGDDKDDLIVHPNEAIVVQIANTTAASNAATNHYILTIFWDEALK